MFNIIKSIKNADNTSDFSTRHAIDRLARLTLYSTKKGQFLGAFIVDKNHEKGLEIHALFEGAIVEVYNLKSGRFITTMALRLGQLRRYIESENNLIITDKITIKALQKSALNNTITGSEAHV